MKLLFGISKCAEMALMCEQGGVPGESPLKHGVSVDVTLYLRPRERAFRLHFLPMSSLKGINIHDELPLYWYSKLSKGNCVNQGRLFFEKFFIFWYSGSAFSCLCCHGFCECNVSTSFRNHCEKVKLFKFYSNPCLSIIFASHTSESKLSCCYSLVCGLSEIL